MVHNQALSLMLVSIAVAVLPGVSRLLRLPEAVVAILFGVVLGQGLLPFQVSGEWLQLLAYLGFLLLMFHAGMEIDFGMLMKQSGGQISFQLLLFGVTLVLSVLVAWLLNRGIFMALVLTTTSLGLVLPILKEADVNRTAFGQTVLIAASLADFLTLFGITFFVLWREYGVNWHFVLPLPLFLGFALVLWAGRIWAWWNPRQASRLLGAADAQELGVRLSLALLFLFVAVSQLVHLEPVLGAFMGGCVLSFVFREKGQLENKLSALGFGFLIPIFFIHVGLQFNLSHILAPARLLFTLKLLVLALLVKIVPSLLLALRGVPLRGALQAGLLLSSRLTLIIAAASIGVEQGFLTPELKDAVVLLALLTCMTGPTLFKLMQKAARRKEESQPAAF